MQHAAYRAQSVCMNSYITITCRTAKSIPHSSGQLRTQNFADPLTTDSCPRFPVGTMVAVLTMHEAG